MPELCSFNECDRDKKTRGFCVGHYAQFIKGKEMKPLKWKRKGSPKKPCSFEGCDRPQSIKRLKLCQPHYLQSRRGDGTLRPLGYRNVDRSKPCVFDGCIRMNGTGIGYCTAHYQQHCLGVDLKPLKDSLPPMDHPQRRRWQKYGLLPGAYEQLLAGSGGACSLCGNPPAVGRALVVDHDHNCCPGEKSCGNCVRGLLCDNCNIGLGHFKDSVESLQLAIEYITRHSEKGVA